MEKGGKGREIGGEIEEETKLQRDAMITRCTNKEKNRLKEKQK